MIHSVNIAPIFFLELEVAKTDFNPQISHLETGILSIIQADPFKYIKR
jgi:hypothetical protein